MKTSVQFFALILAIIFVACGPSDEDKARVKLDYAKKLLLQNDTVAALANLDSIPKLYPEAVYSANAAKNIVKEVRFELLQQKEDELDTLKLKITELEKPFKKEKTAFDRYVQYVHKRQTFDRAWNRSYIQVHLDETGDLFLVSNYYGKGWLNHTKIRVYVNKEGAKTEEVLLDSPDNHHSNFMDSRWEKVTYRNGKSDAVIDFIAQHADSKLKAVFLGKKNFYILLESYDKEAVCDALVLSKAIKESHILEGQIKQLQKQLNME